MSEDRTHPSARAISALLEQRGITQTELARRLGWERMRVHRRLTAGTPIAVGELEQIAAVLDVPIADLLPAAAPAGGPR